MKKIPFLFTCFVILFCLKAECQLTNSIEEYYSFDETTGQAVNQVNPGTNNSASMTCSQGNSGIIANSYLFDGVSQRIDFADNQNWTVPSASSFSISVWIYLTGDIQSNNYANIWGNQNGPQFYIHKSSEGNYQIGWYTSSSTTQTNTITFAINTWYHIAMTKNGNSIAFYRNGVNVGNVTASDNDVNPSAVYIGADAHSSYEAFKGKIDELGIWKRALTSDEIITLYNTGNGLTYPFSTINSNNTTNAENCVWEKNGNDIYYNTGKVSIGTAIADPSSAFTVNGKILAKEIEVVSSITADYVFDPEYQIMPLSELEIYLKRNKHLPGIPSAAEIAKTGQNLGKMDNLLLLKIEELTLYLLRQEDTYSRLAKEQEDLKTRVEKLESR